MVLLTCCMYCCKDKLEDAILREFRRAISLSNGLESDPLRNSCLNKLNEQWSLESYSPSIAVEEICSWPCDNDIPIEQQDTNTVRHRRSWKYDAARNVPCPFRWRKRIILIHLLWKVALIVYVLFASFIFTPINK
uniref:Uncharacterized protein n=1 Tax=Daphnia galeata TaxID=27404 RepID=A0A8J2RWF7_9CRUS|nr:unnamed protein product [Daphnia galeata]